MLPDAGYRLKWTYGVQAFLQWSEQRNRPILQPSPTTTVDGSWSIYLSKFLDYALRFVEVSMSKEYVVKSDLLSYTNADELQQVMDVFIREVRRPTGDPYLPESIYYLCLGM